MRSLPKKQQEQIVSLDKLYWIMIHGK